LAIFTYFGPPSLVAWDIRPVLKGRGGSVMPPCYPAVPRSMHMDKWLRNALLLALIVLVVLICFLIRQPPSADALLVLLGVFFGALTTLLISSLDRQNQLRLAAIDRRLATHQEAYTLWRRLIANVHDQETIGAVVPECEDWWNKNCLFLDPEAREAFRRAYLAANDHPQLVKDRSAGERVKANWADIERAGFAIVSGVALPTLGELETRVK
jgi:hypothetical protein